MKPVLHGCRRSSAKLMRRTAIRYCPGGGGGVVVVVGGGVVVVVGTGVVVVGQGGLCGLPQGGGAAGAASWQAPITNRPRHSAIRARRNRTPCSVFQGGDNARDHQNAEARDDDQMIEELERHLQRKDLVWLLDRVVSQVHERAEDHDYDAQAK